MSAFNTVQVGETCPNCGNRIERTVQFKYGDVWQHAYKVGDPLIWEANNVGEPGEPKVLAVGYPEPCPRCGNRPQWYYDVVIEGDRITGVFRRDDDEEGKRYADNAHYLVPDE